MVDPSDDDAFEYAHDVGVPVEDIHELFELYKQGFHFNEISDILNMSRESVKWVLEQEGLDPLNYGD